MYFHLMYHPCLVSNILLSSCTLLRWYDVFQIGATCVAPLTAEEKLTLQLLTPFILVCSIHAHNTRKRRIGAIASALLT
jgi:hypothetical protein